MVGYSDLLREAEDLEHQLRKLTTEMESSGVVGREMPPQMYAHIFAATCHASACEALVRRYVEWCLSN